MNSGQSSSQSSYESNSSWSATIMTSASLCYAFHVGKETKRNAEKYRNNLCRKSPEAYYFQEQWLFFGNWCNEAMQLRCGCISKDVACFIVFVRILKHVLEEWSFVFQEFSCAIRLFFSSSWNFLIFCSERNHRLVEMAQHETLSGDFIKKAFYFPPFFRHF